MSDRYAFDFHTHSSASDGLLTPDDLVALAAQCGMRGLALTDHDTMAGIKAAREAAQRYDIMLLQGVEISTEHNGASVHILGYGVQEDDDVLSGYLEKFRKEKFRRAQNILNRLSSLHMPIGEQELPKENRENLGRAHIARVMAQKGYGDSVQDAFDRYLQSGKPAYIPKVKPVTAEAIQMLIRCGALPVLAHPEQIRIPRNVLLAAIDEWQTVGLKGIEAYHPSHSDEQCAFWDHLARKHRLLVTGGSDFHEKSPDGLQHGELGSSLKRWQNHPYDIALILEQEGIEP